MANKIGGIQRLINAWRYSIHGLVVTLQYERSFRQEVLLTIIATIIACYLPVQILDKVLLIASVLLVLIVELLNSAVEAVVDLVTSDWDEMAGRAKDVASAAVLLTLLLAALVWIGVLWARFG